MWIFFCNLKRNFRQMDFQLKNSAAFFKTKLSYYLFATIAIDIQYVQAMSVTNVVDN